MELRQEDGTTIATFRDLATPFHVRATWCEDPACGAIHLHLQERGEGPEISISVDAETGEEAGSPSRTAVHAALVQELVEDLPPDWLAERVRKRDEWRHRQGHIARYIIPADELEKGVLQSYTQIITGGDSALYGGSSVPFIVESGDRTWYLDELYCARPDCDCNQAHLACSEVLPIGEDEARVEPRFLALHPLDGSPYITQVDGGTREEAEAVLAAWVDKYGHLAPRLREHYATVREVGERSMARVQRRQEPKKKPGRNGPCPCGSGKKYKRCCGRSG